MQTKLATPMRFTAILGLILMMSWNLASAARKIRDRSTTESVTTSSTSSATTQVVTYSGDVVVDKGSEARNITLVNGKNLIQVSIPEGSMDTYMTIMGVESVMVTTQLTEEWVEANDGTGYYRLDFTFGPSGAFFIPELKLKLKGKYTQTIPEVWLYDENGEALDARSENGKKGMLIFLIPHFSSYTYDFYDEY
jgi:hypothetical protein